MFNIKIKLAISSAVLGFGVLAAVPAKADLFLFSQSCPSCGGLSSYGTVQATNDGSNLKIVETLASGVFFNNASAPTHALLFNLDTTPGTNSPPSSISFSTAPSAQLNGGTANSSVVTGQTAFGTYTAPPFTSGNPSHPPTFEFAVTFDATGIASGNTAATEFNQLTFEVSGMQVANLETLEGTNYWFAADVWNTNTQAGDPAGTTYTGNVAALSGPSGVGSVPEPSTWAMMILGFFGVGFMAYRRKKVAFRMA